MITVKLTKADQAKVKARLLAKTNRPTGARGCWVWKTSTTGSYPTLLIQNVAVTARRVAYLLFKGPPGNVRLGAKCGNPKCVSPHHLFPTTTPLVRKGPTVVLT